MIDVAKWEPYYQLQLAVVVVIVVGLVLAIVGTSVSRTIRVMFRGYEPGTRVPRDCNHDDNLTALCLRNPDCRTQQECDATVARQNGATRRMGGE